MVDDAFGLSTLRIPFSDLYQQSADSKTPTQFSLRGRFVEWLKLTDKPGSVVGQSFI